MKININENWDRNDLPVVLNLPFLDRRDKFNLSFYNRQNAVKEMKSYFGDVTANNAFGDFFVNKNYKTLQVKIDGT